MDELGRSIVSGEIEQGSIIDVDQLESEMGVSRTVVREAIKVLSSKGLVAARPKFGTYVQDRSAWNLLDADVMGWRDSGRSDPDLLRDLDEMRQVVEPAAARLAAERRTEEHSDALDRSLELLTAGDVEQHVEADLMFHRVILEATGNELLGRMEVVLQFALRIRDRLAFAAPHSDKFLSLHAAVASAIRDGNPDAAETAMRNLLLAAAKDAAALVRTDGQRPRRGRPGRPRRNT